VAAIFLLSCWIFSVIHPTLTISRCEPFSFWYIGPGLSRSDPPLPCCARLKPFLIFLPINVSTFLLLP
jgi:hypothetical protein